MGRREPVVQTDCPPKKLKSGSLTCPWGMRLLDSLFLYSVLSNNLVGGLAQETLVTCQTAFTRTWKLSIEIGSSLGPSDFREEVVFPNLLDGQHQTDRTQRQVPNLVPAY